MSDFARELLQVNLEDEMKQSYLDYAMSVIVGRALPDIRDGMKPVHRRVLYAMNVLNNDWNKSYKKSARIVGDVIGKYHPHGDTAVYDTIVRMAQPFSLRYMLVDGQGNFGSVDGDSPAAMRYTEIRMSKLAHELLADLEKETVDFQENYDGSESEPKVLPTKVPNLLINGSSGIAVGMATNIPPHNLNEVISACLAMIDNSEITVEELIAEHIPAPDFPTAGIINGTTGIHEAYRTGRGKVHIRARAHIENVGKDDGKQRIVVTELPYQVNKARTIERIAELVKEKKIEGITELRDESDKDGMRMVVELRRGEVGEVILNNLYRQTAMQTVFGINMVALVDGQPKLVNLVEIISQFIRHRREVVTRRTVFDLRKARDKAHVLEGLAVALANIDEVIALIKTSTGPSEAKEKLIARGWAPGAVNAMLERSGSNASRPDKLEEQYGFVDGQYHLSPAQAQAILELRLHRLTGLEQDRIVQDYADLLDVIADLLDILGDPDRLMSVIRDELIEIRELYGDERRTEIQAHHSDLSMEDLIADEPVVVTLSHEGYVKAQMLDTYQAQRRGGRGKSATATKEEDFVDKLFVANTHDTLLCFTSVGKCYWLKVYMLPQAGRGARGKPIVNLLQLEPGEKVNAVLPVREYGENQYIFMATRGGTVKKTALTAFSRPRANGIIGLDLRNGDELVDVALTDGQQDVMLVSSSGKAIRFNETAVRGMGRTAGGVRGIRLQDEHKVIALIIMDGGDILTAAETGYGKRTKAEGFPAHGRGGQGVIAMQTSERNGALVSAVQVTDEDEVMLITDGGVLIRTAVEGISVLSRNTQGVRLIKVGPKERLIGVAPVAKLEGGDDLEDAEYIEGVEGAEPLDTPTAIAEPEDPEEEGEDEGAEE